MRRSSLPVSVRGRASRNQKRSGVLLDRSACRVKSRSSAGSTSVPGAGDDGGLDPLAPLLVGHAEHHRVEHRRVPQQDVLDLRGSDVLGAPDDRVVGTPADEQVARPRRGSRHPWCRRSPGRRPRGPGPRTPRTPARRARRSGPVWRAPRTSPPGPRISSSIPGSGLPTEDSRARTAGSRRVQRGAMILRPEQRDGRTGLGEPVRVDEIDLGPLPQCPLDERGRHRRAAVGERSQRRHRLVLRAVDDPGEHRRHHHRAGDFLLPHRAKPLTGGESLEHEGAAARVEIGDHVRDGGDVIRRDADEGRLLLAGRRELHRPEHVGDQVLVPEQHALGLRGGAAGVDDDGGRVLVALPSSLTSPRSARPSAPATRRWSSRRVRPARSARAHRGPRSPAPSGAWQAGRRAAAAPAGS